MTKERERTRSMLRVGHTSDGPAKKHSDLYKTVQSQMNILLKKIDAMEKEYPEVMFTGKKKKTPPSVRRSSPLIVEESVEPSLPMVDIPTVERHSPRIAPMTSPESPPFDPDKYQPPVVPHFQLESPPESPTYDPEQHLADVLAAQEMKMTPNQEDMPGYGMLDFASGR